MKLSRLLPTLLLPALLGAPAMPEQRAAPTAAETRTHPFRPGESATYRASWGIFGGAGSATITLSPDTLRDRRLLHAALAVRGGIPGARIDERLESWIDSATLASHRYAQRTRYPRFSRDRVREFDPAGRRWTGHTNGRDESGELPTGRPLDEIAFLFVARTLDLTVGQAHTLSDYWRADGNPVVLEVVRREQVRVPAGTFNTVVVRPIIRTSSLFAEGAEAEVYISESPTREIVMLRAKLSIATLTLRLESYDAGGS